MQAMKGIWHRLTGSGSSNYTAGRRQLIPELNTDIAEAKRYGLRQERLQRYTDIRGELDRITVDYEKAMKKQKACETAEGKNSLEITRLKGEKKYYENEIQMLNEKLVKEKLDSSEIKENENRIALWKKMISETSNKLSDALNMDKTLSSSLKEATTKADLLNDQKEAKQSELDSIKDFDGRKHAEIMVHIRQNLLTSDVKKLVQYLDTRNIITKQEKENISVDFFELWELLENRGEMNHGIAIGNLYKLRGYILGSMPDSQALVGEIEEKEDALLAVYEKGTTLRFAERDTQSIILQSFSQTIEDKVQQNMYKDEDGPFKYFSHVLMVLRCYLMQLNSQEKSEVTDALLNYVIDIEQSEVMKSAESHSREYSKRKENINRLHSNIKDRDKQIKRLEGDKDRQKEKYEAEKSKQDATLKSAQKRATQEKKSYQEEIDRLRKQLENDKKGYDEARQQQDKEYDILSGQMKIAERNLRQMTDKMTYVRELEETRFKILERNMDAARMKVVDFCDTEQRKVIREHLEALEACYKQCGQSVDALHQSCLDYKMTLRKCFDEALKDIGEWSGKYCKKINELEEQFGKSLVTWEKERMQLRLELEEERMQRKEELFVAQMKNFLVEHIVGCPENEEDNIGTVHVAKSKNIGPYE